MKHFKVFNTQNQYQNYINNENSVSPNVSIYELNNNIEIDYNPKQDLPFKYEQLEYIESTGSQYILLSELYGELQDYGYYDIGSQYKFNVKYYVYSDDQANQAALVAMAGDDAPTLYYNSANGVYFKFPNAAKNNFTCISPSTITGSTNQEKMSNNNIYNEAEYIYQCTTHTNLDYAPSIFGRQTKATGRPVDRIIKAKLFGLKIWKDDELIVNLIPCKNNKNEIGLYECINRKFLKSPEGTPFIGGTVISNKYVFLKEKYQRLQYIETINKSYIDLGLKLFDTDNINFDIDMKFYLNNENVIASTMATATIFGSKREGTGHGEGLAIRRSGQDTSKVELTAREAYEGSQYISTDNYQAYVIYYDTNQIVTISKHFEFTQAQRHNRPVVLFARYDWSDSLTPEYYCRGKIYYCYIKQNNVEVRHLIPVKNIYTQQIGLYDTCNDVFYGSLTENTFVAGPVI
jgi:hypothetical protein